jgi:predicted Zn-dependent protease
MEIGIFDVQIETFSRDLALAHVRRGYTQYRTGDLGAAMQEFLEARRLCPDDPYVHYLLGKTLIRFGRPREAQVSLKEAIRLCPVFIDVHYQLGRAYLAERSTQLARAQKAFETEIEVYPSHAEAHYALSRIHRTLGNRDDALWARRRAAQHGFRRGDRTTKKHLKAI